MAANFKIKFMFADAFTIEEEFPPPTTVAEAKTKLISSWPAEKEKEKVNSIDELKMIHSGKLLENGKSFAELKIPTTNQVIMHIQPTPAKSAIQVTPPPPKPAEQTRCCTIL